MEKCKTRDPLGLIPQQFASRAASVLGYVGQLAKLPSNITTMELWAAHKVLGTSLDLSK